MLIDKNTYKKSLADLWHTVFGDDYGFIDLIFKKEYEKSVLCFAEIVDGKAVSAFYLIENTLKFEGESYRGYYLYAAATLPENRKEGLMSKLINEALEYCKNNKVDFVSLVPSEESLYSYYSRFGFCKAMYRYINIGKAEAVTFFESESLDSDKILGIRNKYEGNIISYSSEAFGYALDCLKFSGFDFKKVSDDSYLLSSADDEFSEFLSTEKSLEYNLSKIKDGVKSFTSPFRLNNFSENKCVPYGMLFPINSYLEREWKYTDIYMNIALD